jgi:hypothetical protein
LLYEDALSRYEHATDLAAEVRAQWEKAGRPKLALGGSTGKADVTHPLVRLLMEAERDAARFGELLRPHHAGPDPVAVVGARIGMSPSAKLRAKRQALNGSADA